MNEQTKEALESFKLYLKFVRLLDKDIFNPKNHPVKISRLAEKLCEYLKLANADKKNEHITRLECNISSCKNGSYDRTELNSTVYNSMIDKEARKMLEPLFE